VTVYAPVLNDELICDANSVLILLLTLSASFIRVEFEKQQRCSVC
jgi:hypothetical protein